MGKTVVEVLLNISPYENFCWTLPSSWWSMPRTIFCGLSDEKENVPVPSLPILSIAHSYFTLIKTFFTKIVILLASGLLTYHQISVPPLRDKMLITSIRLGWYKIFFPTTIHRPSLRTIPLCIHYYIDVFSLRSFFPHCSRVALFWPKQLLEITGSRPVEFQKQFQVILSSF